MMRMSATLVAVALSAAIISAQASPALAPIRNTPTEKFTVNPGHRDWSATVISGTTIIGGNSSNRGGLFAVDTESGKLKWTFRPTGTASGNPFVVTKPAVAAGVVVVPMGNTLVAATIATGREAWRGPRTALEAAAAADGSTVFVLGDDGTFHAIDAATGKGKWTTTFQRSSCASLPVAHNGGVAVSARVGPTATQYAEHLISFDANTGQERWRYPTTPTRDGFCLTQAVVSSDRLFGVSGEKLYAIDLKSGKDVWTPVTTRAPIDGRDRDIALVGLVDGGTVLVGVTPSTLIAVDKASGRIAWQLPGQYHQNFPSTAVAGGVLYVQGHPGAPPASEVQDRIVYRDGKPVQPTPTLPRGRLNAIDLATRSVPWTFSCPTAEPNWPFGFVTPVDGGLWVDSYQALVKLQ